MLESVGGEKTGVRWTTHGSLSRDLGGENVLMEEPWDVLEFVEGRHRERERALESGQA